MVSILLVDDSRTDRTLFGTLLERDPNFQVTYANDGTTALQQVREHLPNLVVTDLQMPGMDGLQLVRAIRSGYTQIPVILLTAYGSEELATKALQQGAAGYVPKSDAPSLLVETVNHVLSLTQVEMSMERVAGSAKETEVRLKLNNDMDTFGDVVALSQKLASGVGISDTIGQIQVGTAIEEALENALYHGNLEIPTQGIAETLKGDALSKRASQLPYRNRDIQVKLAAKDDSLRVTITDQGLGFDVRQHSKIGLSLSGRGGGRGLFLMWAFMDRVLFNRAGNSVTMVKRAKKPAYQTDVVTVEERADIEWGELVPTDGEQPIRLRKGRQVLGRHTSCDITVDGPDVSSHHCVLFVNEGWWFVKDLGSKVGIQVDGNPVVQHRLSPGSKLAIGEHTFEIQYDPSDLGAEGTTPPVDPF